MTYNEGKSVFAERFIKTFKSKIYKKFKPNDNKSCLGYLNKLVDEYNNSYHHSIGKEIIVAIYSGYARNAAIFGVSNSSSSYADNCKNSFVALGEGGTFSINGISGASEKKFSINFTKVRKRFSLSLYFIVDNSYLFINGKEIFKFKANNGNVNFPIQICLGSISNGFGATESRKVWFKGNV